LLSGQGSVRVKTVLRNEELLNSLSDASLLELLPPDSGG